MNIATKSDRSRFLTIESMEHRCLMAADFYQPAVSIAPVEQLAIELLNRARANPALEAQRYGVGLNDGLPAGTVTTTPKQPLAPVASLLSAAELHSKDMIARDYFDHTAKAPAPNGVTPTDRAHKAGYTANAGENLAYVSVSGRDSATLVQESHRMLMQSSSHRQNLLLDRYTDVGVGIEFGEFTFGPTFSAMLTTEMFGKSPTRQGAITGVIYSDTVTKDKFYTIGEGINAASISAIASDGTTYVTATGVSGGYTLRVPDGKYEVYARLNPTTVRSVGVVTIQGANIKLDLDVSKPFAPPPVKLDTNQDGSVSSLDALVVINFLNSERRSNRPSYSSLMDVNADGTVSSLDILRLFNFLNSRNSGEAEAERTSVVDSAISGLELEFSGISIDGLDDADEE